MVRTGYSDLPRIIKTERERLKMTQADLAKAAGLGSSEFISMIEGGIRKLDLDRVPMMARALSLNPRNFCKLALKESYPDLYETLYGKKPVAEIRSEEAETFQVPREAYAFWTQFSALPHEFRQSVMNIVRLHYRLQLRGGRSSGIPRL